MSALNDPLVLGIETSCDETAAALYQPSHGLLKHLVLSQHATHQIYGGIVPELASRDHVKALLPLVKKVVANKKPDLIACTAGPGLASCLAVGISLAQSLALAWQVPLAAVNHLEGHLLSPLLNKADDFDFPYLALLISGGNTCLYDVVGLGNYKLLAETLDDAVGEGFDKTASLLGLPYPGGPELEKLASKGNALAADLPIPMNNKKLSFSFSGLKTAAKRRVDQGYKKADIAAAFQSAAIASLIVKTELALVKTGRNQLAVVGGVACNGTVRSSMNNLANRYQASVAIPKAEFCVDNAAMIALAGCHNIQHGYDIKVRPRWSLTN